MREFLLLLLLALLEKGRAGTCVPPTLAHGSVSGQGDTKRWTGRFSCLPGFTLVGSSRLKCQGGTWSSSPPLCAGGYCDPDLIPQVVHAKVHSHKPRKFRGSVYTYSCNHGFERFGGHTVVCVAGTWTSAELTVCAKSGCDESLVTHIPFGEAERRADGAIYTFRCNEGGVMEGPRAVFCDGSRWNGSTPHCMRYVPTPSLSFDPLDGPFTEAQTVSVKCVGKEVEPPSSLSLDLVKDNSSTSLGYSEDGYLHVPLSDYILPHFHGALVRCTAASGGEAASGAVAEVVLNITYGPERVQMSGPESARRGASLEYVCATSASNPPATIEWEVSDPWEAPSPGSTPAALEQVSPASEVWTGQGWESRGRAVVRALEAARALLVRCTATSQRIEHSVSTERLVRLHYPPDGVALFGPTTVHAGQEVQLKCESQPAFPAPLLSWMIKREGEEMEVTAEDTIKEQEKGVTSISILHFTAGLVGRMEVECSAVHESLGEERRVARHQINIIESLTESTETPEHVGTEVQDATKTGKTELKEEIAEVKSLQASSSTTIHLSFMLPFMLWTFVSG